MNYSAAIIHEAEHDGVEHDDIDRATNSTGAIGAIGVSGNALRRC